MEAIIQMGEAFLILSLEIFAVVAMAALIMRFAVHMFTGIYKDIRELKRNKK